MRTGVCLLALLVAALFLFSVTDGNFLLHGDDLFILGHSHNYDGNRPYLLNVAGRQFLTLGYVHLFEALQNDTHRMHWLFLMWHVGNVFLCFVALRKLLGARPALVGSLFYLVYTGPLETLTWLSAGGYLPVMTVFFLSVWIALSDARPWTKGIVIGVLNWAAMHLYEMPLIAAPLYPALEALRRRRAKLPILTGDFVPTLLPLAMGLMHWGLMYVGSRMFGLPPNWMRNPSMKTDVFSLLQRMWFVAKLSLWTCCGSGHWDWLGLQWEGLRWHGLPSGYWVWFAAALAALGAAWFRVGTEEKKTPYVFATSLYLILLTPLIGFTIIDVAVPQRLLVLVSAGLALLAASITARWPKAALLLLIPLGVEAFAMQSAMLQEQTAQVVDQGLRRQLAELHLQPQLRDTFFVSMKAPPERYSFWRAGFPQFYSRSGMAGLLLVDYGLVKPQAVPLDDRLPAVDPEVRGDRGPDQGLTEMNLPFPKADAHHQFFAFRASDEGRLQACTPLRIMAGDRVVREYRNPAFDALPAERKVSARASALWLQDETLRLNHYAPDLILQIRGRVFGTPADGKLDVMDGQVKVATIAISKPTDAFVGEIPLSKLKPDSVLTLVAGPGVNWQYHIATFSGELAKLP